MPVLQGDEYDKQRFVRAKMAITVVAVIGGAVLATVMIARGYGVVESLLVGAMILLWIPLLNLSKWWYKK